jgi:DNA modification methylase
VIALYSTDRATIIVGDARDVLAELETESVDLVVTDPPIRIRAHRRPRRPQGQRARAARLG